MSPSQAERLIAQMRPRPALWDLRNHNYNNRPLCDREWSEMAIALKIEKDVVKAKWKSLRDTYRRELRKAKLGQESKWIHYSKMSFLRDVLEARDRRRAAADTTTTDDHSPHTPRQKWSQEEDSYASNSAFITSLNYMPYHAAALAKVSHSKEDESEEEEESFPIIKEEPDVELTMDDISVKEYGEHSTQSWMDDNDNLADNPRKMFLLSLLPDINQMTEQQMRLFKKSVLQLTCQILDSKDGHYDHQQQQQQH